MARRWPAPALLTNPREARALTENEQAIVAELAEVQGKPVDIGGYYMADPDKVKAVMRPSKTLNAIIDGFKA